VYLAITCLLAGRAPLWYDELFTFHLGRLTYLGDLWRALAMGTDGSPPLLHVVTHLTQQALGMSELASRLPAVFGFWLMSVCLYLFVARRCSRAYAVLAMLFPLATAAYPHAYNARPYGLLLGCCGLALVCWQSAAEGRRRRLSLLGLALSFAVAFASHYYAVLLLVPFCAGELVRTWTRRRVDWPVWLALGAGPVALVALLPVALGARDSMGQFGFLPGWPAITAIYLFLLKSTRWPLLVTAALAVLVPERYRKRWPAGPARTTATPPAHEVVAAAALAALPVIGVCLGQWLTGVFTARYAVAMVLGFAILLAFVADRRTAGHPLPALVLSLLFLSAFARAEWREYQSIRRARAEIAQTTRDLNKLGNADLPVVIADPFAFLQLAHYAPPTLQSRLAYVSHPEAACRCNPHDSRDWALRQLGGWSDVPVRDYRSFVAGHGRFLVYGDSGWLRATLEADGFHYRVCDSEGDCRLFEAEVGSTDRAF
jgi:hypothetical protein